MLRLLRFLLALAVHKSMALEIGLHDSKNAITGHATVCIQSLENGTPIFKVLKVLLETFIQQYWILLSLLYNAFSDKFDSTNAANEIEPHRIWWCVKHIHGLSAPWQGGMAAVPPGTASSTK